ncbi:transposase [Micromonospora sp. NPDC050495]|uniref:transposase n=1 Tax=Micromonospora sp. NPDC050495 TaxID=3154936 RepID=UPI0033F453C4
MSTATALIIDALRTTEDRAVAVGHGVDPAGWRIILDEAVTRVAGRFVRAEPRRTAGQFVEGLLSGVERKSCWSLGERAGHTDPQAIQRLLRTAAWDADAVRDDVRDWLIEQLGHPDGVLVIDETGDLKKGRHTVGVVRWGVDEVSAGAGPFPTPSSRTGRARFRASGSPVTTA